MALNQAITSTGIAMTTRSGGSHGSFDEYQVKSLKSISAIQYWHLTVSFGLLMYGVQTPCSGRKIIFFPMFISVDVKVFNRTLHLNTTDKRSEVICQSI